MLPAIPLILGALKFAPAVFEVGKQVFEAVTGEPIGGEATPETLAEKIEALPADQRAAITKDVLAYQAQLQALDTQRFMGLTDGDAEKVKATARPEIARRAMSVIEIFPKAFLWLVAATIGEWLFRALFAAIGQPFPVTDSLWSMLAEAAPITELIWPPLVAALGASVAVITKYMGCRERDKAQEFEIRAGRKLDASDAVIEAAGGIVGGLAKRFLAGRK